MRLTWVQPEDLLPHELAACRDEGRDVSEVQRRWVSAGGSVVAPVSGASGVAADPLLRALAVELLDELDAVAGPVPVINETLQATTHAAGLDVERVHRAWAGRAAGCLLGKPVEKIPRQGIREILESSGRWPLSGYFTANGVPTEVLRRWPWNRRSAPTSLAENIDGMPEDDDLNYALLALHLLETHGREFTSAHVAQAWLDLLPAGRVFTAERIAYRNLLLGLTPPQTARHHNPFREWIGAQIRADVYGWASPGQPILAAAMAARDAAVSHVGDGIHGARWVAAMTATAVVASTVDEVLDAGEAVLPQDSRLGAAVRKARRLTGDWESRVDEIYREHGHLHWVHVRNNASLVAAALAYGRGDFSASITAVVSGGWDTDSNGATVGSIVGALSGSIAPQWTDPLKDTLRSSISGFDGVTFSELAARVAAV
ncbi:ADP-ribosylglycohydrolase family protein [Catelliglobosispora koreensis]|uniref:ADP-ribosylglycohydrolase family protein n=1 Tax=Catelliglobosispora koreensis TaxID=129052 RepID=UPI00037D2211|nr:ADP-ribosylglycohydrolase family protein [Catelliglobosispora koreensis]